MDTLDYTSGKVNEGSKAIMLGLGEPVRDLPREFRGSLPGFVSRAEVFCADVWCCKARRLRRMKRWRRESRVIAAFADWPLIVLHDDASVARSSPDFLWSTWTRFEPAADIYSAQTTFSGITSSTRRRSSSTRAPNRDFRMN